MSYAVKKWKRPQKADMSDKRCVNVAKYDDVQHKKIIYKDWCFGCEYYVCRNCAKDEDRSPTAHNAIVHHATEVAGPGDDYDLGEGDDHALPH